MKHRASLATLLILFTPAILCAAPPRKPQKEENEKTLYPFAPDFEGFLGKLRFTGEGLFPDEEMKAVMQTKETPDGVQPGKESFFTTDSLDQDLEKILDLYRTRGYLRASSAGPLSPGLRADDAADVVIKIHRGDQYKIRKISFTGNTVFKEEDLRPLIRTNEETTYSSQEMRDSIRNIRDHYGQLGYADCTLTPDIRDAGANLVDIVYRITEGKPYRVGQVVIEGNTKTIDRVIRRELSLQPGEPFNSLELETARSALLNTGFFSDVQVDAAPSHEQGFRDVNVLVDEKRTSSISTVTGMSSLHGMSSYVEIGGTNFDAFSKGSELGGGWGSWLMLYFTPKGVEGEFRMETRWLEDRPVSLPSDWKPQN